MKLKERNKYSTAELALLAVFALGLFLSILLVANRKRIPLSPAIIAPFDGLKNTMPSGKGWRSYDKWEFLRDQNAFILVSLLRKSSQDVAAVIWKYDLPPAEMDIENIKNTKAREGGYVKVKQGGTKAANLDFTVLIFTSHHGLDDCYYALCKLPMGGVLTLEVKTNGDEGLARRAFNAAIEGLSYTPDWPPPDKKNVVQNVTETKAGWAMPMLIDNRKESKWTRKYTKA